MFYSNFVLVAKGPLGQVWISAHANRKLTKQQIQSTNIDLTSKSILQPATPFALRLSGQLLLGLVRIYSRKVKYLFEDCSASFNKMKTLFRPSEKINLSADQSTAQANQITLADATNQLEFAVPLELDLVDSSFMHNVLTQSQLSFDEHALALDGNLSNMGGGFMSIDGGLDELDNREPRDFGDSIEIGRDQQQDVTIPSDFGDFDISRGDFRDDSVSARSRRNSQQGGEPLDLDFSLAGDNTVDTSYAQDVAGGDLSLLLGDDAAGLPQLDLGADMAQFDKAQRAKEAEKAEAKKKKQLAKRKAPLPEKEDVVVELESKKIQEGLRDVSDIVTTRKPYQKRIKLDQAFFEAALFLPSAATSHDYDGLLMGADLINDFRKSMERAARSGAKPAKAAAVEASVQGLEESGAPQQQQQEEEERAAAAAGDFDLPIEFGDAGNYSLQDESTVQLDVSRGDLDASRAGEERDFFEFGEAAPAAEEKEERQEEAAKEKKGGEVKGQDLMKTRKMLQFLQSKIPNAKASLSVHEHLKDHSRAFSAGIFYQLLVLKTLNHIDVVQDGAYEDIVVKQGPAFSKDVLGVEARQTLEAQH